MTANLPGPYAGFLQSLVRNKFYSLHPTKTVRLGLKFNPTNTIRLDCSKVHLIKVISNTKKELHWEEHGVNQMFK